MPRKPAYLLAALLIAASPTHTLADPTTYIATVTDAPVSGDWPGFYIDSDDDCGPRRVSLVDARIVWHLDKTTPLPLSSLQPGTRVRVAGTYYNADRVEIVSLGPWALQAAVEEWVVQASGNMPERALTPGQLATMEALGSTSHLVRESVTRALRERGFRDLRFLCWARHARDAEVRARAELLLGQLGWER